MGFSNVPTLSSARDGSFHYGNVPPWSLPALKSPAQKSSRVPRRALVGTPVNDKWNMDSTPNAFEGCITHPLGNSVHLHPVVAIRSTEVPGPRVDMNNNDPTNTAHPLDNCRYPLPSTYNMPPACSIDELGCRSDDGLKDATNTSGIPSDVVTTIHVFFHHCTLEASSLTLGLPLHST
ncbi:uncharacterized protein BCR38DRAFT_78867 [Pseudomassariella vexata]|uniref:Uncharacterized protein n=1 Tax=Pseudomassariella vexata TaxID=1141098 RepID=A0A1Y2DG46_9PEZI|nr:uncharacterized protein BCR38DRAFT_78867 [Pseudomassariella vexata]ORY58250.1 hypothetical protein BCR38DRAFT_78867 [Pseudomassariella vexata]